MKRALVVLLAIAATLTGTSAGSAASIPFSGARPFSVFVPSSYSSATPAPLVIALSGYNQTGAQFERYLKLTPLAQKNGFLYVVPDGSADLHGIRFWNGTPECCDFQSPKVNDDAYIMKIIDQVSAKYSVDLNRIYIVGHSNGGFMANHLACLHADRIAAVINFAGGSFTTQAACKPSAPISVLEVWGRSDETYVGNHILGRPIPGAVKIFNNWGAINQCAAGATVLPTKINLLSTTQAPDTTVSQFQGCPASTAIDFWSIDGAAHAPTLTANFRTQLVGWLLSHPKVATN